MPRFEPFAGLRYASATGVVDDLIAPPYDVIGPDERAALEARSPHNAVAVELPRDGAGGDRYAEAARLLAAWQADGTLVRDDSPSFYAYRLRFTGEDGVARSTAGVIGALELSVPGTDILPHERTTSKDKADRLDILRAARTNLSPIWALSPTAGLGELCGREAPLVATATDDDGVTHDLHRITDPALVAAIRDAVAANPVVVADGHHRYEVGLAYKAEQGVTDAGGEGSIMALIVELADDQLTVRPINRLLSGVPSDLDVDAWLGRHFELLDGGPLDAADADAAAIPARMADAGALALIRPEGVTFLRPLPATVDAAGADLDSSRLDVALADLPDGVDLRFQHGVDQVVTAVGKGEADLGVLLRPATVAQIAETGRGGARMPPKTTFFWPKPRTGLVFRPFD